MAKMLHDQIRKQKLVDTNYIGTDATGLRQVPIATVGSGKGKRSNARRSEISGLTPHLEPPLNRPLNEPNGPPAAYGWDNLGSTAAPPRYVDSSPHASHRDIAARTNEIQDELATRGTVLPAAPATDGLTNPAGERVRVAEAWPHGKFLEAGVPGTGIFSGFISSSTTGEFNPDMFGWNAMHVYEQMRRTDADVAVALFAMKLPMFSVTPEIIPGETEGGGNGNLANELAQFVREIIFGGLERENPVFPNTWVTQPFDEVKENGFLMLDFGCAAHENLWRVDGKYIRPRYLAPRLPHTFYRFWTAEDGETLTGLEQLGYRRERYVSTTIPANNLCMYVNRKEGSNFFGISALRAAYQHWYTKSHFYRIDAIAMERNGMGIPWIKFPAGAKVEDIPKAQAWVEQMAVSERTGLALPDGYEFEIAGLKGRLRDPINSIKHHSQEIVRSVMAMFVALGTTETGSRALANTLLDLFRQSLQHYAGVFCSAFNNQTIRPLVDLNYSPRNGHRLPYPKLEFPSIVVIDPVETSEVLSRLGNSQVDLIRPSVELERAVLQKFGLPMGAARTKFAPTMTQVRIMAQPAGEETVGEIGRSQAPIEEEKPLIVPKGATPVEPAKGSPPRPASGSVMPTGQGDEFAASGSGQQIHDMVNEIVAGPHGTAAQKKRRESNPAPRRFSDITDFQGIPVHIETDKGEVRRGRNEQGQRWQVEMTHPYGYMKGTIGLDNEEIDCFVGRNKNAKNAYIALVRSKRK